MDPLYLGLEIGAASLFVLAVSLAARSGRLPVFVLLSAAGFGLLLEQGSQLIFETYEYSPRFVVTIDRAPLVIGLSWALIIAGAIRITDALGVRRRYAPFVDSVLAIVLDLAFDAIAIRVGLWTWRNVALDAGWFGVTAGNLYTWLFITFAFSLLTRSLRARARRHTRAEWLQLLVPIPAFAIVLASLAPFIAAEAMLDAPPGGAMPLFAVPFAAFVLVAAWGVFGPDRARVSVANVAVLDLRLAFVTRAAIHLFFLGALLVSGYARELPVLLVVALALLAAEVPLAWLAAARLDARTAAPPVRALGPPVAASES